MVRSWLRPTKKRSGAPEASLPTLLAIDHAFAALAHASVSREPRLLVIGAEGVLREEVAVRCSREATMVAAHELDGTSRGSPYAAALWIAPQRSSWRRAARALDAALAPGGCLAVIGGGPLAQAPLRPGVLAALAAASDARRIGRAVGYRTLGMWRLYGLRSAGLAALRIAADVLRQPHLADRFEAAYCLSLGAPAELRGPAGISIWVGRRPRHR